VPMSGNNYTVSQAVSQSLATLQQAGVSSSVFEIKLLISHILHCEPKDIAMHHSLDETHVELLQQMIKLRLQHCPADKIIGEKGFYKYDFAVNENVLSPRADTEILVEKALENILPTHPAKILEFGTGSGCIILSLLAERPLATGWAIDISEDALAVADINAEKLAITPQRLTLTKASWFDGNITKLFEDIMPFDIIVSNPPYIPTAQIAELDDEVKLFDPHIALDGGKDGLKDYNRILELSSLLLSPKGTVLLEAGDKAQLEAIAKMAVAHRFNTYDIVKDLCGSERCIILKK